MKRNIPVSLTALAAFAILPLAAAQDEVPGKNPGDTQPKPAQPSDTPDTTRPEDKNNARENRREHDAAVNPASETEFVQTAAQKGAAEVKIAQLAVEKAEDPKVKALAETLVKDHSAANAELKPIADDLNIKPAEQADAKAQQKYNELNGRTGKEFDQAFIEHMAKCHEKSIALLEAGRKVAKEEKVIAYIDKTLPVVKGHVEKIRRLNTENPSGTTAPGGGADRGGSQPQAGTDGAR